MQGSGDRVVKEDQGESRCSYVVLMCIRCGGAAHALDSLGELALLQSLRSCATGRSAELADSAGSS